jgi:hypothetical protein
MTQRETPEEARRRLGIKDFFGHQPVKDSKAGRRPCKICHSEYEQRVADWFSEGLSYQEIANKLTKISGTPYNDMNVYRHVRHSVK